jgi:hypothetical protein
VVELKPRRSEIFAKKSYPIRREIREIIHISCLDNDLRASRTTFAVHLNHGVNAEFSTALTPASCGVDPMTAIWELLGDESRILA